MATERDLMIARLAAAYGALRASRVHQCPFCDWSVLSEGLDFAGLEEVILDHLDADHDGWTLEQVKTACHSEGPDA